MSRPPPLTVALTLAPAPILTLAPAPTVALALSLAPGATLTLTPTLTKVATAAYVGILDHYKLDETDIPLLMINRSSPITVMDVSAGARKFLASHSYEQYRKNHPFKKHPSQTTESRPDIAERGNMRVDN